MPINATQWTSTTINSTGYFDGRVLACSTTVTACSTTVTACGVDTSIDTSNLLIKPTNWEES